MGLCYDIEGNSVDCGGSDAVGYSSGVSVTDTGAGLNLTDNPVQAQASNPSGPSIFGQVLNFGTNLVNKVVGPSPGTSTNLRLQVNPATGQMQYYNPATNQFVGGPVNQSSGLFGGSNSFLLILVALAVAFFAFGGRKALAKA